MFTKLLICIILFLMLSLRIETSSVIPSSSISISNSISTNSISVSASLMTNSVSTSKSITASTTISATPFSTPVNPPPINFTNLCPFEASRLEVCLTWKDPVGYSSEIGYILTCYQVIGNTHNFVRKSRFEYTNRVVVTGLLPASEYYFCLQGIRQEDQGNELNFVISVPVCLSYSTPSNPCTDETLGITGEQLSLSRSKINSEFYDVIFSWTNGANDYAELEIKITFQVEISHNNFRVLTIRKFANSQASGAILNSITCAENLNVVASSLRIRYFHVTYSEICVVHRDHDHYF